MLNLFAILRYALQLFGLVAKEVNDAERQHIGQEQEQLKQDRVDLDAIQKANQAATAAVNKFGNDGVQ